MASSEEGVVHAAVAVMIETRQTGSHEMARKIFAIGAASMGRAVSTASTASTEAVRLDSNGLTQGTGAHHPGRPNLNAEKST
jgi:hypothetical protein